MKLASLSTTSSRASTILPHILSAISFHTSSSLATSMQACEPQHALHVRGGWEGDEEGERGEEGMRNEVKWETTRRDHYTKIVAPPNCKGRKRTWHSIPAIVKSEKWWRVNLPPRIIWPRRLRTADAYPTAYGRHLHQKQASNKYAPGHRCLSLVAFLLLPVLQPVMLLRRRLEWALVVVVEFLVPAARVAMKAAVHLLIHFSVSRQAST